MKLTSKNMPLVVAWILTLAVSFTIGHKLSAGRAGEDATPAARTPPPRSATGPSHRAPEERPARETREFSTRGTGDFATAIEELLALPAGATQTHQLLKLLDSLSPGEFPEFVERFRANPLSALHQAEYRLILGAWTEIDPYGAAEHLEVHDQSGSAREAVMAAWAARDPVAAQAWARDRADEGNTNNWTVGLARGLASSAPDEAMQLLEQLKPGRTRDASVDAVIPFVLRHGFDYARDWVLDISNDGLQSRAVRVTARGLARMEASRAGQWVADMPDTAIRRDASEEVAGLWAREDLESAREWTEGLPEDTRTEAAEGIAREMAKSDPQGTADWLIAMGDNPDLDGARRVFLQSVQRSHPELALDSVATLSEQGLQSRYYSGILSRWAENDSEAARSWVSTNSEILPERVVKRYLRPAR